MNAQKNYKHLDADYCTRDCHSTHLAMKIFNRRSGPIEWGVIVIIPYRVFNCNRDMALYMFDTNIWFVERDKSTNSQTNVSFII